MCRMRKKSWFLPLIMVVGHLSRAVSSSNLSTLFVNAKSEVQETSEFSSNASAASLSRQCTEFSDVVAQDSLVSLVLSIVFIFHVHVLHGPSCTLTYLHVPCVCLSSSRLIFEVWKQIILHAIEGLDVTPVDRLCCEASL